MLKTILTILFVTVNLVYSQGTKSENERVYRFVYSLSATQVASPEDAQAVSKVLAEHIKKKLKRFEKIEVVICKNKDELLEKLKSGYELLVLATEEFLMYRKQFHITASFTSETNGSVGFNYLLIVNKEDNISNINQLKGTEICIQEQATEGTPELLVNKILQNQKLPPMDQFFNKITKFPSINNVVLPVFFKKAKSALVTEQALRVLKEINPQIEKQLKVIYRSPSLILAVSCFNENIITPEKKKLMTDILLNLHTDVYGKQLLNLFSTDKLVPYKEEYLKEYINLFEK